MPHREDFLHSAHDLDKHSEQVQACAVSADGLTVLSASDDHSILVWDLRGRASLRKLSEHTDEVFDVDLASNDATRAISACKDGIIRFFFVNQAKCIAEEQCSEELQTGDKDVIWANDVWISSDGTLAVGVFCSSANISEIIVYKWPDESKVIIPKRSMIFRDRIVSLTVSSKQKVLAFYSPISSSVHVVDLNTFDELRCIPLDDVTCLPGVVVASNSPSIVVADSSRLMVHHTIDSNMDIELFDYTAAERRTPCSINSDGSRVVCAIEGGKFGLWDTGNKQCIAKLSPHPSMATACSIAEDASKIITGYDDGLVRAYDTKAFAVSVVNESEYADYYFRTHFGSSGCDLDNAIYGLNSLLREQGFEPPSLSAISDSVMEGCGGQLKLRITEIEFRSAFAILRENATEDISALREQWSKMFDKYAANSGDKSLLIFASGKLLLMQIYMKLKVEPAGDSDTSTGNGNGGRKDEMFTYAKVLEILRKNAKNSDVKIFKEEFIDAAEEVANIARNL